MAPIELYEFPKSSASYRVRIALNLLSLPYESVLVDFREQAQRSDAYLKVSPYGLVPHLRHGSLTIGQSVAILRYLDRMGEGADLFPDDDREFLVEEYVGAIACDIHPLNNLRVLNYLKGPLEHDQMTVNQWYHHWIKLGFEGLEQRLSKSAGRFCVGDEVTAADVCLIPQVFNANRYEVPLSSFPTIARIEREANKIEAFRMAGPAAAE